MSDDAQAPPDVPADDVKPDVVEGVLIEAHSTSIIPAVEAMLTRESEIDFLPEPRSDKPVRRLLPEGLYAKRARRIRIDEITVEQLEFYLTELMGTGLQYLSAERAGLSENIIRTLKKNDTAFAAMCDKAMSMFIEGIVAEVVRRARDGWDEAVFSQKLGTQIGTIRKYDGKLMELLVKRYAPEFREKFESAPTVTNNVIVVPQAAATADDWVKQNQLPRSEPPRIAQHQA